MQLKPEEISKIIRAQIKHYENAIEQSETGTVIMVGEDRKSTRLNSSHTTRSRMPSSA